MSKHEQHIYQYFRKHLCNKSHQLKYLEFFSLNSKIPMDLFFHDATYNSSVEMDFEANKIVRHYKCCYNNISKFCVFLDK